MLCAHVAAAEAVGLPHGVLNDPLGPRGEALGRGKARQAGAHDAGDGLPGLLRRDALAGQTPVGRAALLPHEAQQQVLAAYVAVAQLLRGLLGQAQGALGPGGESVFVHAPTILVDFSCNSIPVDGGFTHFFPGGEILPLHF